jgi:nucleoside-diphosphate kinase
MIEHTLAIIKPDGVARGLIGEIIRRIESHGLRVQALKMVHLSKQQAEGFYAVHRSRPCFFCRTTFN